MDNLIYRIFVEKKSGFDVESDKLLNDLKINLGISNLERIRILICYDLSDLSADTFDKAVKRVFSDSTGDKVFYDEFDISQDERIFGMSYLPGQYDQRADSAEQCIKILSPSENPIVRSSKFFIFTGNINETEFKKIKKYIINPVDSHEIPLKKHISLTMEIAIPDEVEILEGFIDADVKSLKGFSEKYSLAMNSDDLCFCRDYFKNQEKRNPTITEIKVIDTYWSDHCRHTTFSTKINKVKFPENGPFSKKLKRVWEDYLESRKMVYGDKEKDITLMDLATICVKELKKNGLLDMLDESEEINACSIRTDIEINGKKEKYLIMFKNETHNHPTEIEPFGGAATCLGGAIRDPLSGRAYVYQAMRVTGSGDPRVPVSRTLSGKLPQKKITLEAAHGYSSYGNQIGIATGQVHEIYDEGYVAKRMEVGAVIAAVPAENVVREIPLKGDKVILVGGKTGRDGCGGATGSSKKHDDNSLERSGAEVQKGNAPEERKLQRLFRNSKASRMIKRCNDFGAGGVSVAIGELTDGITIFLDKIPKKYEGLDGTELAISESQERMAVVVSKENETAFKKYADEENLLATTVAEVTDENRLVMVWRGNTIVDLSRNFLNTNGMTREISAQLSEPSEDGFFNDKTEISDMDYLKKALGELRYCSQKGLGNRFDGSIGASTVLSPFGGKNQLTPSESMVSKIPITDGECGSATMMSFGFNPEISRWSPFHGAVYSIIESVSKIIACGGRYNSLHLSLQEYFERLDEDEIKWGNPVAALLGAYHAQKKLGIAAIGGKDSMSGTFNDISVPPTLISFAVGLGDAEKTVSAELKNTGSTLVLLNQQRDENNLPDFEQFRKNANRITELIYDGKILASSSVKAGGALISLFKMCAGNSIGFDVNCRTNVLSSPDYGSYIFEISSGENPEELFKGLNFTVLGKTTEDDKITINGISESIENLIEIWRMPLNDVFCDSMDEVKENCEVSVCNFTSELKTRKSTVKPRVFIPVFPGTNCEYDSEKAFLRAGAEVNSYLFRNLSEKHIKDSIESMVRLIDSSQIIMIPGGFSAGDEPDGSGKFIANVFRNNEVHDSVMRLLNERDGLILGICNGFQALIKLGLVPYGYIKTIEEKDPTLTYNKIGRHFSGVAYTRVVSSLSPWLSGSEAGEIYSIPVSHGEGRFVCDESLFNELYKKGQIATQYVDLKGIPTMEYPYNPNGSFMAVEGITSPDGRIFGKMGHSERIGRNVFKNIPGKKDQMIFESGVKYFKI